METHVLCVPTSSVGVWDALGSHCGYSIPNEGRHDAEHERALEGSHSCSGDLFGASTPHLSHGPLIFLIVLSLSAVALCSSYSP